MQKDCLGDYEIIKQISKNALVTTYLARHRFIKKHFIIKKLCQTLTAQDGFLERFEKFVPKLSLLHHLNLCQIHTISKDEQSFFLVYENFYEKHPSAVVLSDFLKNCSEKLELHVIESIVQQISSVCDYIHSNRLNQAKMFHGAITLDSVFIAKTSENNYHVVLSDLGIFQILGSANLVAQSLNSTIACLKVDHGAFDQTLVNQDDSCAVSKMHLAFASLYSFLSPEQKRETQEKVNYKSDIFQVGVLTYYLFMGHFPSAHFPWASTNFSFDIIDWDLFLQRTLSLFASKRSNSLTSLIDECKKKELGQIQEGLTKFIKPKIDPIVDLPSNDTFEADPQEDRTSQEHLDMIEKSLMLGEPSDRPESAEPNAKEQNASRMVALEQSLMHAGNPRIKVSQISVAAPVAIKPISTPTKQESTIKSRAKLVTPIKTQNVLKPKLNPSEVKKNSYEKDPGAIFKKPLQVSAYTPKIEANKVIDPILNEMAMVPAGSYLRGSEQGARDEKPRHQIEVNDFAIDLHPVTNEQFIRFLQVMMSEKDGDNSDTISLKDSRIKKSNGQYSIETGYAKHPVVGVSWYGANAYAQWIGKRLPTEAEWEVAAHGGVEDAIFACGPDIERTSANFFSSDTTAVMSYPPNSLGLYDIAGNVYEWVEDWYSYSYFEQSQNEPNNPQGPQQGVYRVLRGGCWKSLKDDLRLSHRHRNNPKTMNSTYGFRLAADVQKGES